MVRTEETSTTVTLLSLSRQGTENIEKLLNFGSTVTLIK
jgi:hypothetical protein